MDILLTEFKYTMKLDHVVYFSNRSPEEIVLEHGKLGRNAVVGGRHKQWGTQNALLYLRNAYVEWLSVEDQDLARLADHPLTALLLHDLASGEGWGTLCISVENLEQFDKETRKKNFNTSGVIRAQRKTPNGDVRKWKMLFIDEPVSDQLPLPFFIEWEETEKGRFETLRKDKIILPSNEFLELTECVFHVKDPSKECAKWATLLSQEMSAENHITLPNAVLKFVQGNGQGNQRLSDVLIQSGKMSSGFTIG